MPRSKKAPFLVTETASAAAPASANISKRLRFEVFARDGFTCQYCGQRPPDVILELDHIHPRAKGGSSDLINLITACFDCNRGKRDKILKDFPKRPDADLESLRVQQEIVEVKRFLAAKEQLHSLHERACAALQNTWAEYLTEAVPSKRVLTPWINRYGVDEIDKAIKLATIAYTNGRLGHDDDYTFRKLLPWVGAILRNRRDDREAGVF